MEEITIQASQRHIVGKQVKTLRLAGKLPAVLYGKHIEPIPLELDLKQASRILQGLSPSALITLQVDGEQYLALVRDKQRHVLRGTLQHVDFQALTLTEKVRSNVTIELTGVSPAVRDLGGFLVTTVEQMDVECLPRELPENIKVDISSLVNIGDSISVRDLALPSELTVFNEPDDIIAVVIAPEVEPEEEEEEVEVEEFEPELVDRGKRVEEKEEKEEEEE